jgi:uncharacterized membrane protein
MKGLAVTLLIAYPVLVHASVMLRAPLLAFLALLALVAVALLQPLVHARIWAWAAFAAIGALLWLLTRVGGGIYALYLPSLVIPAALGVLFGSSLRRGRTPLISGIARAERGGVLPDELAHYTRRLTALWTLMFALMFACALTLIVLDAREWWSLTSNVLNYLLIGVLVVGEYAYRRWRYRAYPHPGLIEHIRTVARSRPAAP